METCNHNLAAPPCQVQKPIQVSGYPSKPSVRQNVLCLPGGSGSSGGDRILS